MKYFYILLTLIITACGGSEPVSVSEDERLGSLPRFIIEPESNQSNKEKVALGKLLFWDPILSGDRDIACASCHHPSNAYAENIDLSIGVGGIGLSKDRHMGKLIKRNAPTIINTAFNGIDVNNQYNPSDTVMFWDNRASNLEDQAMAVLLTDVEMRGQNYSEEEIIDELVYRLTENEEYLALFTEAFGDSQITGERIVKAIAAFERSILSFDSPFDRYARGDDSALDSEQIRGLNAFIDAGCNSCHSGPMFSDFELHALPISKNKKLIEEGIIDEGLDGKFRTPSLRNVALTAPYMHNGTENSLIDAISFYDDISNPQNDPDLGSLDFEDVEDETLEAIEAFLEALTDQSFDKTVPESVPSGLNPGGDI